jgi:hypothetical protein
MEQKDTKLTVNDCGFEVGDFVSINLNGEAVKAVGTYEIVGVVSDTKIMIEHEPDAVERLAAVVDDDIKERVKRYDSGRYVTVRTTDPFQGEVKIRVGRQHE